MATMTWSGWVYCFGVLSFGRRQGKSRGSAARDGGKALLRAERGESKKAPSTSRQERRVARRNRNWNLCM